MNQIQPLSTDWYRCSRCKTSYLVRADDPDRHLLKPSMRCPNYSKCKWRIRRKNFTNDTHTIHNARWIAALELFQAASGIGLPEERKCSVKDVQKMLVGSRVVSAHLLEAPDPKKSVLMSLTLDNGKVLHLTTSVKGPMVYKVTEKAHVR